MAAVEMYDYLSTIAADYSTALAVYPSAVLVEQGEKNQVVNTGDDGSEERISLDDDTIFTVTLQWNAITAADAGTILDFYLDAAKANGMVRSFKWAHPTDGHVYVVRFAAPIKRKYRAGYSVHGIESIQLRVLGRIADA